MCLIFIAHNHHPRCPLVMAANRDEFYQRPTAPAGYWPDHTGLLAGKDLEGGGTWLGITRSGRFSAVTNYREPGSTRVDAPSRGKLVTDFLVGHETPMTYLSDVASRGGEYNGFNLLAGDKSSLCWYSNRAEEPRELSAGVYALSNHLLDTPWPKVARGRAGFETALASVSLNEQVFLDLLSDREVAVEEELPNTGVGRKWEHVLAPIFISSEHYGTRSSTVVMFDNTGTARFTEKSFGPEGETIGTVTFEFPLTSSAPGDAANVIGVGQQARRA